MITYNFTKVIMAICLLISIVYILRKQWTRRIKIFYIIISTACFAGLSAFPVENYFHTFDSVRDAYEYMYSECSVRVIEGENSALAIPVEHDKEINLECFIRTSNGWKLKNNNSSKIVVHDFYDEVAVTIIECLGDNYVIINTQDAYDISDNKDSYFIMDQIRLLKNSVDVTAYAYVKDIINYELTINGETIKIT